MILLIGLYVVVWTASLITALMFSLITAVAWLRWKLSAGERVANGQD